MLTKIATNNGGTKGIVIKRTVTLKEENISWDETWYVSHADAMKVLAEGKNPDGTPFKPVILDREQIRAIRNAIHDEEPVWTRPE